MTKKQLFFILLLLIIRDMVPITVNDSAESATIPPQFTRE